MPPVVDIAVPRKGRPLEAVLDRFATAADAAAVADGIVSTLRDEKAIATGDREPDADAYDRLRRYGDPSAAAPDFTLLRDDRPGKPRRIVFDCVTFDLDGVDVRLIGREEPFRALRTHAFPLGFDSADLVLEEVVPLDAEPVESLDALNARIDPYDTDVRVVGGLGDTVHHTLLATPEVARRGAGATPRREFVSSYRGQLCIAPRYERLVAAVLGTAAIDGVEFTYPATDQDEEGAIAEVGLGVYLTETGATARDHGLVVGETLFPSETVLFENAAETSDATDWVTRALVSDAAESTVATD